MRRKKVVRKKIVNDPRKTKKRYSTKTGLTIGEDLRYRFKKEAKKIKKRKRIKKKK